MTIGVDFDGVIHKYSEGWKDGSIYDPPVEGAIDSLFYMMAQEPVFIHTSRNSRRVSRWIERQTGYAIECTTSLPRTWYGRRKPFWDEMDILLVTNYKYPAWVYIDDRAVRFTSWTTELYKK